MELMPHVKALLDDLINITKTMVVKRTDIALANEGSSTSNTDLYYAYKKVIDGDMTFNSIIKKDIPYNVLRNIKSWHETNMYSYDLYPTEGTSVYQYKKDDHTITIRNRCDSNNDGPEKEYIGEIGDIYVRQDKSYIHTGVSGDFIKLYKENHEFRSNEITLYNKYTGDTEGLSYDENTGLYRDNEGNIVNSIVSKYLQVDDDGYIVFMDSNGCEIELYVKDNSISTTKPKNALRKVKLLSNNEYVSLSTINTMIMEYNPDIYNEENILSDEDTKLYLQAYIAKSNGIDPDTIFPGYSNLVHGELHDYAYEYKTLSDGSYELVEYVHDNDIGRDRIKTSNDENYDSFYSRSYSEIYFDDDTSYTNNYVYVDQKETVPIYYELQDENTYYQIPMPALAEDGDYLKDENGDILLDYETGIYSPEEICDDDIISEAKVTYYKYTNTRANMVDFDKTFLNEYGEEVYKYSKDLIGSIDSLISQKDIILYSENVSTIDSHYVYYTTNGEGYYYYDNNKYILIPTDDIETFEGTRYEKHTMYDIQFFFTKNGDKYIHSDAYVNNNTYYYYNDDVTYYTCGRFLTDSQINDIRNGNTKDLSDDTKQVILQEYCNYILDKYAKLRNDPDLSVTRYDGETNAYYRSLNGLPPVDELESQPKIDRYSINSSYDGDDPTPYIYNLTDEEVDIITDNGTLDKFKNIYTDADYLYHLGRNRIDVIKAREAGPFEILKYGSYENIDHLKIFNEAYLISKNYIINNYYKPEMFDVNEYYGSFIGMIILAHAMEICMSQSSDILIYNKYSDYDTVQLKLKSFGFENTFDHIPLVYRKNIAKNIELLVKNKGIDKIYDIIYTIFGINDIEVYKYYIRKIHKQDSDGNYLYEEIEDPDTGLITKRPVYEISMVQVPTQSDNIAKDIINPDNAVDYDTITNSDKYWGVYDPKSVIKEMLEDYSFNYMNSKYITLNNKFDLSDLNFSSSYYLNYVFDLLKDTKYEINIDEFEHPQNLKNLLVALFAIQSIKYGYNGDIPNDIVSTAAVYKFNLNEEVTITGKDAISKSKLIEIIDKYYTLMSNRRTLTDDDLSQLSDNEKYVLNTTDRLPTVTASENYWRGKGKANNIKNCIINGTKPPIVTPDEITDSNALDEISDAYLENLIEDDRLTSNIDENSFYNMIKKYRDDAKSYNDYICFEKLLEVISTAKIVNTYYSIDSVWEEVVSANVKPVTVDGKPYTMVYEFQEEYYTTVDDEMEDKMNSCWKYNNIQNVWSVLTNDEINNDNDFIDSLKTCLDDEFKIDINKALDKFYICTDVPELNKLTKYQYAIRLDSNIERSEFINHVWFTDDKLDILFSDKIRIYKNTSIIPMYQSMLDGGIPLTSMYISNVCSWNAKNITVAEGSPVVYQKVSPTEYSGEVIPGMYYVHVYDNEQGDNTCTFKMYRYTNTAFTYEMYLKYKAPELYSYIQQQDSEDHSSYLDRINQLYSIIIASIDNSLSDENTRDQLNLSLIDFSNIAKYIKILINVFKSYTIDLASMDAIYTVDDKSTNRVKAVDNLVIHECSRFNSNSHTHSSVAFHEGIGVSNRLEFRDEIIIE